MASYYHDGNWKQTIVQLLLGTPAFTEFLSISTSPLNLIFIPLMNFIASSFMKAIFKA